MHQSTQLGSGKAEKEINLTSFQEERKIGGQQEDLLGSALSSTPSHGAFSLRIDCLKVPYELRKGVSHFPI